MKARGIIEVTNLQGERMQVRKSAVKAVIWRENVGGWVNGVWVTGFFELLPSKQDRARWHPDWYSLFSAENPFDTSDTREARMKEIDKRDRKVRAAALRKATRIRRAAAEEAATKHRLRHERYAKEAIQ